MNHPLADLLARTPNPAADDLLLEALRRGNAEERARALDLLLARRTGRGTGGVVRQFADLAEPLQARLLTDLSPLDGALRDLARSADPADRIAALDLIARGTAGRLANVAAENVNHADPAVSTAAAGAIDALSRRPDASIQTLNAAVDRALGSHDGPHAAKLADAALRLGEPPVGPVIAALGAVRHKGKERLLRRLADPPAPETVGAFLTAASRGFLRPTFASTLSRTTDPAAIAALLDRTRRLCEPGLASCLSHADAGPFWNLTAESPALQGWGPMDLMRVTKWVAAGKTDEAQFAHSMRLLLTRAPGPERDAVAARAWIARSLAGRSGTIALLETLLDDPAEPVARAAAQGLIRCRSKGAAGIDAMLLRRLPTAGPTVRHLIARAAGRGAFESFWEKADGLPEAARRSAGRALVKLLPDAAAALWRHDDPRVRARAVQTLGTADELGAMLTDARPAHRLAAMAALRRMACWRLLGRVTEIAKEDPDAPVRRYAAELLRAVAAEQRDRPDQDSFVAGSESSGRRRGDAPELAPELASVPLRKPELPLPAIKVAVLALVLLALPTLARAEATAAEVARGVNDSMNQTDGGPALMAVGAAVVGLLVLGFWWNRRKPEITPLPPARRKPAPPGTPRETASPKSLRRELCRALGISRREMRELKRLAKEGGWSDPLLPLLCPSVLEKPGKTDAQAGV